ncbi:RDD family protein [Mesorhizobium sp. M1E.F.Ca.ET.063.01.1.1]|uniref:RDD family protein n=1 Tax=Mesorhizobium sp. M1E.F.Ca.ET.063.01.1.1 TaxID=2496750 RepID=UPI000FCC4C5E|nr:RDD family protein [Mesorhizobium sp. M1E.F.Ca.ET.063.01.1.1]RUW85005.1 RDD family protein [Mesorhizobium sp. M1E.F.Ca.ET.063.01.1.1]
MKQWHYAVRGQPSDPFTASEIEEFYRSGKLNAGSLIWADGMQQWKPLGETEEFKHLCRPKLPPPLPPADQPEERNGAPDLMSESAVKLAGDNEQLRLSIERSLRVEPAGPWSRYFARQFDLSVITTVLFTATAIGLAYSNPLLFFKLNSIDSRGLFLIFLPAAHIANAVLISLFGNSMGKALFGIKAVPIQTATRFSFSENLGRELRVWTSGLAFGIPLICLATMIPAFNKVKVGQPTSYDEGRANVLAFSSSKARRGGAMLLSIAVLLAIMISNSIDQQAQREASRPSSWTNPETSIPAAIPANWQYEKVSGPNGETLYAFTNTKSGVVAMLGEEKLPNQSLYTYGAGLTKMLSSNISLGKWNASDIANVWVTSGAMNNGNHPAKIFIAQKGSTFWRVILLDQFTSGNKDIAEPDIVRALFSSAGVP